MHFWKMEATGNDFVVIEPCVAKYEELARMVCHRHFGIGADGLLVIDFKNLELQIYNADGSKALLCGNGLRCIAFLLRKRGYLIDNVFISIGEHKYEVSCKGSLIYINMGKPLLVAVHKQWLGSDLTIYEVELGVKHWVIVNADIKSERLGTLIESIEGNINFVNTIDTMQIHVSTLERGVGWTLGCGSGACASVFVGQHYFELADAVLVKQAGGSVLVSEEKDEFYLCGGASLVFEGEYL